MVAGNDRAVAQRHHEGGDQHVDDARSASVIFSGPTWFMADRVWAISSLALGGDLDPNFVQRLRRYHLVEPGV